MADGTRARLAARVVPPGHPPVDVLLSWQVSWLAGPRCCLAFPTPRGISDTSRQWLAAYSCGGSSGMAARAAHRIPSWLPRPLPDGKNHDPYSLSQEASLL